MSANNLSVNKVCKCCIAKHRQNAILHVKLRIRSTREKLLPADPGHFHAQYSDIALLQ